VVDANDSRATVDDPSLDPVWEAAGSLDLPIVILVADPVAFFEPLDAENVRWDELRAHPDRHFPSPTYPSFLSIVEGLARGCRAPSDYNVHRRSRGVSRREPRVGGSAPRSMRQFSCRHRCPCRRTRQATTRCPAVLQRVFRPNPFWH